MYLQNIQVILIVNLNLLQDERILTAFKQDV